MAARAAGPRVAAAAAAATAPRAAAAPRASTIAWPLRALPRPKPRPAKPARGLLRTLGAFVISLPDNLWLDRLVRGRSWIPVLGVLLAGIVATQVEILKLGASMGRAIEQTTTLTSQNEQLRESVATLGDDQRIERLASSMGMVLPPPGAVGYLAAGSGGAVNSALANIHSPDPSAFVSLTPHDGDGALVTGPGTSTMPPPPGAPVPPPASGVTTSTGASTALSTGTASSAATGTTTATTEQTPQTTSQPATSQSPTDTATQGTDATATQGTDATATGGTDTSQTQAAIGETTSSAPSEETTQSSVSGAAAIQPSDSSQPGGGG